MLALGVSQRPNSQDRSTGFFTMCRPLCTVNEGTVRAREPAGPDSGVCDAVPNGKLLNCYRQ
jgi:hypothetical protein